jgi:hypothetical protein
MTSALEGGEWSAARPGRILPPGKSQYPSYRRLSGPQDRSGQLRKISLPQGFDPRTVQPVAQSLYRLSYPAYTNNKTYTNVWQFYSPPVITIRFAGTNLGTSSSSSRLSSYTGFKMYSYKNTTCSSYIRLRLKCDGTRAETRFRLSAKRTSPFKSAGGVSSVDYWQPSCAHQR